MDWAHRYMPLNGSPDEVFKAENEPRRAYGRLLDALAEWDPEKLVREVDEQVLGRGIMFDQEPFALDPLPRLIEKAEWERIESGLVQRATALDAFVRDAYGERRIFAAGVAPERILSGPPTYEPLAGELAQPPRVHIIGFDLARRGDGEMVVLEDNVRTPSGLAYALAAREVITGLLDPGPFNPHPIDEAPALLGHALRDAAPDGVDAPRIVLVSDGHSSTAWWEHRALAASIEADVATLDDLEVTDRRLWTRGDRRHEQVDVVYRRTDDPRLTVGEESPSRLGKMALEPLRTGTLGMVNAFGAGVADDKLTYAYTDELIRFYLDEEPLLRTIPTYDPCVDLQREEAIERVEELVVKPRFESGGDGVLIVGEADSAGVREARDRLRSRPEEFVAQERIALSTHPCLRRGKLEPRRVDLRPFAYATAEGFRVPAGGLTRYAPDPASAIVNSSQGGGGKDTWIAAATPG